MSWWGEHNKVVADGLLWNTDTETDFQLTADSPARQIGIDLSKPWTLDGVTHPPLPGMEPGYFEGPRPDAGAKQHRSPAGKAN
jgi:hypothetical protein